MAGRVVIASAVRTPFTRAHKGELKDTRPDTMAAIAIKEAIARVPGLKPEQIEDVVLGCAMPEAEQGMNVARIATLLAGLPDSVPAMTINRFCSSGTQAIATIGNAIRAGQIEIGLAGGTESMSMVPIGGHKPSAHPELMEKWPEVYISMGATAENVAAKFGVPRDEQDQFAAESQRRAAQARENGRFREEIVPVSTTVFDEQGRAHQVTVSEDTIIRADTTLEGLQKLKPAFNPKGTVTAGNASPLTDGAAAVVLMSEEKAKELGVTPLGYYVDFVVAGVPPEVMGIGPVPAVRKLLERHGLTVNDIDVFELNEAFAIQVISLLDHFGIADDDPRVNPWGGAIAFGHPLAASGVRLMIQLAAQFAERPDVRYGLTAMCVGLGQGGSVIWENPHYDGKKR